MEKIGLIPRYLMACKENNINGNKVIPEKQDLSSNFFVRGIFVLDPFLCYLLSFG